MLPLEHSVLDARMEERPSGVEHSARARRSSASRHQTRDQPHFIVRAAYGGSFNAIVRISAAVSGTLLRKIAQPWAGGGLPPTGMSDPKKTRCGPTRLMTCAMRAPSAGVVSDVATVV